MPPEDTRADRAYEWTVRALYVALVVGNLAMVYDAWKDTTAGIEWRAKLRARVDTARAKASNCEGCARRKAWIERQVGHVLWEATEIVEQADRDAAGSGPE